MEVACRLRKGFVFPRMADLCMGSARTDLGLESRTDFACQHKGSAFVRYRHRIERLPGWSCQPSVRFQRSDISIPICS